MHHWTVSGGWPQLILIGIATFLCNPLHYVATGFIIFDLARNIRNERDWFGVRVTRIVKPLLIRYFKACLVGGIGSIALLALGVTVSWQTILLVALMSIALGIIRSRFASTPFAISATVTLSLIARLVPATSGSTWDNVVLFLRGFEIESWMLIGVVTCLAELFLGWWNMRNAVLPALVTSKRGRRIGALRVQLGFVAPLALWMTPVHHGAVLFQDGLKPWLVHQPVALCAISVAFGVHGLFTALRPERVLVQWRWWNAAEAVVLGIGFAMVHWLHASYGIVAAPLLIAMLEMGRSLWRRVDASTEPLCAPDPRGVTVLYTIHDSLSEKLGLRAGDVVTHVNLTPVHTEYDLHFAFEQNPAYAKFQIIDSRGEVRLLGNPIYEGERHQLGLLVVVQNDQPALRLKHPFGFLETIYLRRN